MANTIRNFIAGRMNKVVDERLIPDGEYIDALNIRLGSTESSEVGSVENSKGNDRLTTLEYIDGTVLSVDATCIGAYADGEQETMYWFIHDESFTVGATGKLDLIVSYNTTTLTLTYHVISIDDGGGVNTALNFSKTYLITGINLIDNLLFFTDDLNQPRRINVNKNYGNPTSGVDTDMFSAEDILVVKAPPIAAPTIAPFSLEGEDNFLEDRLISFAYRYKYEDNEYSAISQFSAPSFVPEQYNLSNESYLNEGMVNSTNACVVTYNSGGPLVVGIDLLFKEMTSDIIKVIEKIDKANDGIADNVFETFSFSNSKIFTVLPSSEILRLYDNVPLLAKAQTVMGNRLMYGNYVDGWDLKRGNAPTQFNYSTELISEPIGLEDLSYNRESSLYTWIANVNPNNSQLNLDLSNVVEKLKIGATIDLDLSFTHYAFANGNPTSPPIEESTDRQLNFLYTLTQNYNSVSELYASVDFQEKIGTVSNILPVYSATVPTSCSGLTLTDLFNCTITDSLQGGDPTPMYKYASGITGPGEPVRTSHLIGSDIINFQFPAMQFVSNVATPGTYTFEYYSVSVLNSTFSALGTPPSLHSNRGYEIGMVYMDEFNRATTALVSRNNTIHVGCSKSANKNEIKVTIPTTQVAPDFAKRYKFVIKPDETSYDTVYTSIFFYDPVTATDYFLLQGENAAKVEEGDRLIVKRDVDGALNSCKYVTVLEKKAQEQDFIAPTDSTDTALSVPQGVYMQIRSSEFNSSLTDSAVLNPGTKNYCVGKDIFDNLLFVEAAYNFSALLDPDLNYPTDGDIYPVYDIPVGSRIRLRFEFSRKGTGDGDGTCERRIYKFDETYVSSQTYGNIIDWWNGDNIGETIDDGEQEVGGDGEPIENVYITPTTASTSTGGAYYGLTPSLYTNYYRWYMHPVSNEIRLALTGTKACGSVENDNKKSCIKATIDVARAENTIVFETEPVDALPDVWYESSESYSIDASGYHEGNVQTQTVALPAIIDTAFFNCFAFGNGVESYKIRDSMSGRALALGNRVTTVAAQDFKRADRYADMTYSGVFNNEFNLNKLNEFNLGLANYKPLEESFGPIEKMFAQDTNILVLQEDKISYVLASKNLISDSVGGGVVASIPEILGTQIARVEEFGISNNPESFAQWGPSKYFTDAKRGAVIQLTGSGPAESLAVVSEAGMRSWFRDMFISNFTSQKLGGYDPYMNEYVLGNNLTTIPEEISCIKCGVTQTYSIQGNNVSVCYNLGATVGDVTISWPAPLVSTTFSFTTIYNGVTTVHSNYSAADTVTIVKDSVEAEQLDIVFSVPTADDTALVNFLVACPVADTINIVLVTLTNNSDAGKTIHNQYRWIDGQFSSPTHSNQIPFLTSTDSRVVSQYSEITGPQGAGIIPAEGATVYMISDKQSTDDYNLNVATDKFLWLRSPTLYPNTETGISNLLAAAATLTPTGTTPTFSANFPMPSTNNNDYLYLVWNYSTATAVNLCSSAISAADACCVCTCGVGKCTEWLINNTTSSQVVLNYTTCGGVKTNITLGANNSVTLCADGAITIVSGPTTGVNFTITECDCT
jgi:hypothetical protein